MLGTLVNNILRDQELDEFARALHQLGLNVVVIKSSTKKPTSNWQHLTSQPQTVQELEAELAKSHNAIGVVNGFADVVTLDIDADKLPDPTPVLAALGLPRDYAWLAKSGSGTGLHVHVRCVETIPTHWNVLSSSYRTIRQIEVRKAGHITVVAGAHPTGPGYQFLNSIPTGLPTDVTIPQIQAALAMLGANLAIPTPTNNVLAYASASSGTIQTLVTYVQRHGGRQHRDWINAPHCCPLRNSHQNGDATVSFGVNLKSGVGYCFSCQRGFAPHSLLRYWNLPVAANTISNQPVQVAFTPALPPVSGKWSELHLTLALIKAKLTGAAIIYPVLVELGRISKRASSRAEIINAMQQLGVGKIDADNWLRQGVGAGVITRVGRGQYEPIAFNALRQQFQVDQLPITACVFPDAAFVSLDGFRDAIIAELSARLPLASVGRIAALMGIGRTTLRAIEERMDIERETQPAIEIDLADVATTPGAYCVFNANGIPVRAFQRQISIRKNGTHIYMMGALRPRVYPRFLKGTIERILHIKEEYCVFLLRPALDATTLVKVYWRQKLEYRVGDEVSCDGRWQRKAAHGTQFCARTIDLIETAAGVVLETLASQGLLGGIDQALVTRLRDARGSSWTSLLYMPVARLKRILGAQNAVIINQMMTPVIRAVVQSLEEYATPNSLLEGLIYLFKKPSRLRRLRRNPYHLSIDDRFSFVFLDAVGHCLKVKPDDKRRIAGGLLKTLQTAHDREAQVCLDQQAWIRRAAPLLGVTPTTCDPIAVQLQHAQQVTIVGQQAYLPKPAAAEAQIAAAIMSLVGTVANPIVLGAHPSLNQEQRAACQFMAQQRLTILIGNAGTAKTHVVSAYIADARAAGRTVRLLAPTAKAAQKLQKTSGQPASTIHRALGMGKAFAADIYVVDELSMVDQALFARLLKKIPARAQLILIGDSAQLPSIQAGQVLADLVAWKNAPIFTLTQIQRQASGSLISTNAKRLLQNQPMVFKKKTDCVFKEFTEATDCYQYIADTVGAITQRVGDVPDDLMVLTPSHGGTLGTRALNYAIQDRVNPAGQQTMLAGKRFRVGDRVVCRKNDYKQGIINGSQGRVTAVTAAAIVVAFDGHDVTFTSTEADRVDLSYATTIHAAQGSECKAALVITHHEQRLNRNLLYTALTRGKQRVHLIGSKFGLMAASATLSAPRTTGLTARLP